MLTFNSMMNEHLRKFGHVKAMERSIHSARLSFVETLHREGKMSDPEYAILDDWYRFLTNQELPRHPSGFDTDADLIGTTRDLTGKDTVKSAFRSERRQVSDTLKSVSKLEAPNFLCWHCLSDLKADFKVSLPAGSLVQCFIISQQRTPSNAYFRFIQISK